MLQLESIPFKPYFSRLHPPFNPIFFLAESHDIPLNLIHFHSFPLIFINFHLISIHSHELPWENHITSHQSWGISRSTSGHSWKLCSSERLSLPGCGGLVGPGISVAFGALEWEVFLHCWVENFRQLEKSWNFTVFSGPNLREILRPWTSPPFRKRIFHSLGRSVKLLEGNVTNKHSDLMGPWILRNIFFLWGKGYCDQHKNGLNGM